LKISFFRDSFMIGVASYGTGGDDDDDCMSTEARWARTDKNWKWLKNTIGNCTDNPSHVSCW
jgi:hypothetical protein